ncbi:hypothetical protein QLX67_04185 [Balneolaceae bacterium ANBcel3]|nr:hypothetical protein [Balneolaceae bacterium ANBcel3]
MAGNDWTDFYKLATVGRGGDGDSRPFLVHTGAINRTALRRKYLDAQGIGRFVRGRTSV